jgi:hypothetical protein
MLNRVAIEVGSEKANRDFLKVYSGFTRRKACQDFDLAGFKITLLIAKRSCFTLIPNRFAATCCFEIQKPAS